VAVLTPGLIFDPVLQGLKEGLTRLGYYEGKNVTFMVHDTQGDVSNLAEQMARIVAAKPDLIVAVSTANTAAAMQATSTVPIIFTFVGDPQHFGFIAGSASSKNNLTGVRTYDRLLSGKRLEILKEIAPHSERILTVVAANEPMAVASFQSLRDAAQKLAIQIIRRDVTNKEEIEQVLQTLPKGSVDAIYYIPSNLVSAYIDLLITKAREDRLPMIVLQNYMVDKGALVSYGSDARMMGIQAAKLVAKVLRGAKPSEIPIQTTEQLLPAINLTTAKAIGLDIPRGILERTDRFVE
jgi:putative ABC transport system substrate-binding protein